MELQVAIDAADQRKQSAGVSSPGESGIAFSGGEQSDRAIFSGFDIEYTDLLETVARVSWFFTHMASQVGLQVLFSSAWTDGLLVGLMVGQMAPRHTPPGDGDVTGGRAPGE